MGLLGKKVELARAMEISKLRCMREKIDKTRFSWRRRRLIRVYVEMLGLLE